MNLITNIHFLTACVLVNIVVFSAAQNPAIKFGINTQGLEKVKDDVFSFIRSKIASAILPTLSGPDYRISSIKINSFELGKSEATTTPPNRYSIVSKDGAVIVKAEWKAWKTVQYFSSSLTLSYNGKLSVNLARTNFSQNILLRRTRTGKPQFAIGICNIDVGSAQVQVHNTKHPWVVELISNATRQKIRHAVQQAMCPVITQILRDESATLTDEFEGNFAILPEIGVNLDLLRPPLVRSSSVEISLRGRCFPQNDSKLNFPFSASNLPALTPSSYMARMLVSKYTIDTMLYSLQASNYFRTTFMSNQIREAANTIASRSLGIYASRTVEVFFNPTSALTSQFNPPSVEILGNFTVHTRRRIGSRTLTISRSNAVGRVVCQLSINATSINVFAERAEVSIGNALIRLLATDFLTQRIEPVLQSTISAGFKFPEHFGYSVEELSVRVTKDSIEVEADFN